MNADDLGLEKGNWVVADCGKMPSEKNCKLIMMAPENQREDLVEAGVSHAVKTHGHQDTPELRSELDKGLSTMMV